MRIVLLETEQRHSLLHGAKKKKQKNKNLNDIMFYRCVESRTYN